jgi:hypothetical protein
LSVSAIFGGQLAKVIQQMIIISQLARLGLEFELRTTDPALATSLKLRHTLYDLNRRGFVGTDPVEEDDQTDGDQPPNLVDYKLANNKTGTKGGTDAQDGKDSILTEQRDAFKGSSGRMKVLELLDAWEEPELEPGKEVSHSQLSISMYCILSRLRLTNDTHLSSCFNLGKYLHQRHSPISSVTGFHGFVLPVLHRLRACRHEGALR